MKPSGGDTTIGTCKYTYSSILEKRKGFTLSLEEGASRRC